LTEQTEIHLRFHNAFAYPIKLWTTGKEGLETNGKKLFSVKVAAKWNYDEDQIPPNTLVKVLSGSDCQFVYQQPPCGVRLGYQQDDMLVFSTQLLHDKCPTFVLQLFSDETSDPLGVSWLVPEQMVASSGVLIIPILSNNCSAASELIGSLSVDFLKITPFCHASMDLSCPYRQYWNCHQKSLDIGHRGMGMSFTSDKFNKVSAIPENTIHSFLSACDSGADYIEFDVQLSSDRVLVIFHDLSVSVSVSIAASDESLKKMMLVKDFTVQQLSKLKIDTNPFSAQEVASGDLQFFPTLEEIFQRVPEHVGFYMDIKYTEPILSNVESDYSYFDRNEYADLILNCIFCRAKSRPIVMASFDPDMCTLLHMKQPQYPVLFLTCGENDLWPVYRDIRQRTLCSAIAFAKSERLMVLIKDCCKLVETLHIVCLPL
jgi:glycerophosphoryl diester phosphodiesterase